MIVNDEYGFVFVHIPKNAGTSIRHALSDLPGNNLRPVKAAPTWHETPQEMMLRLGRGLDEAMPSRRKDKVRIGDYLFFCVVRNPWARFYSLHQFLKQRQKFENLIPSSVNDFALMLADGHARVARLRSIRPQAEFTAPPVSAIARFENLNADFAAIMERFGLTLPLERANDSGSQGRDYRSLLSSQTIGIIADRYKADIEAFGYTFE